MENVNSVARLYRVIGGHHNSAVHAAKSAGEANHALFGPLGIAFGDGHGGFRRHPVDIGIAARLVDFTQDEEGPIGLDLDADFRVFDIFALELGGDIQRELVGGQSPRAELANQRHGDRAVRIDAVDAREIVLAEHDDAHAVARVEPIGAVGVGRRARRAGIGGDQGHGTRRRQGRWGRQRIIRSRQPRNRAPVTPLKATTTASARSANRAGRTRFPLRMLSFRPGVVNEC